MIKTERKKRMPILSQIKRERMLAFLQKIMDEHRVDDDILIALGEIESELTSRSTALCGSSMRKLWM